MMCIMDIILGLYHVDVIYRYILHRYILHRYIIIKFI